MAARARLRRIGSHGMTVDVGRVGARTGLAATTVRRIVETVLRAEGARRATISVTFVTDAAMGRLNAKYLGRRGSTDVIAFGMDSGVGVIVADLYVAPAAARRTARAERIAVREELVRLIVHGTLHALGHDHPDGPRREQSAMWRRQEALVRRVGRWGA